MKRQPYNGWFNRATWNVALWIGNDEGLYNQARYLTRQAVKDGRAIHGPQARLIVSTIFPKGMTPDDDLLEDVHWPEIANNLREMFL